MPRSKVLATYDAPAMFRLVDEAIKAGPVGHSITFLNAKHANNYMLDFYGFRNALWTAIDRHGREDLRGEFSRVSRIKVSKQSNSLLFTDRTAMQGYSHSPELSARQALAAGIASPEPASLSLDSFVSDPDTTLAKLGYSTTPATPAQAQQPEAQQPGGNKVLPPEPVDALDAPLPPRKPHKKLSQQNP